MTEIKIDSNNIKLRQLREKLLNEFDENHADDEEIRVKTLKHKDKVYLRDKTGRVVLDYDKYVNNNERFVVGIVNENNKFISVERLLKKDIKPKGALLEGRGVTDYVKAVVKGRNDYPPKMREILKKYGDKPIMKIFTCRNPVGSLLTGALNAVSMGEFNKRFEQQPYDKLFHLDLRCEVDIGEKEFNKQQKASKISKLIKQNRIATILLEKREILDAVVNPKKTKETECQLIVNVPQGLLTINKLLEGGKKVLGNKFFTYSAYDNNCQNYVMALLKGSNIGSQENYDFVKQNTKELFKGLPGTRKIANTVTDLGATFNTLIEGAGNDPCWKGYEQYGMKMKKGKEVPNCIPVGKGVVPL